MLSLDIPQPILMPDRMKRELKALRLMNALIAKKEAHLFKLELQYSGEIQILNSLRESGQQALIAFIAYSGLPGFIPSEVQRLEDLVQRRRETYDFFTDSQCEFYGEYQGLKSDIRDLKAGKAELEALNN